MTDAVIVLLLNLSLATMVTSHLATVWGLLFRKPWWRAPITLICPPLGPLWAWKQGMLVRAVAFVLGSVGYAIGVVLAQAAR